MKQKENQIKPNDLVQVEPANVLVETPSCIPTLTNVSKDLPLLAKRSSSIRIEFWKKERLIQTEDKIKWNV